MKTIQTQEKALLKTLAGISRIVAITGAGISKESNIPTFRDQDGIWARYDPSEFATGEAITKNLNKVWAWLDMMRLEMATAKPNAAHTLLAELDAHYDVVVCTQNIDGLHQEAGSKKVIEIHGNITRARCPACKISWHLPEEPLFKPEHYISFDPPDDCIPRCLECRRLSRPDVVLFNEPYGRELTAIRQELQPKVDLVLIIGTSGGVPTPYYLALEAYERHNCPIIDLNPGTTLSDTYRLFPVLLRLQESATAGMKLLCELLAQARCL